MTLTVGDDLSGEIAQYASGAVTDAAGDVVAGDAAVVTDADGDVAAASDVQPAQPVSALLQLRAAGAKHT